MSTIYIKNYNTAYDKTKWVYNLMKQEGSNIIIDLGKSIDGLSKKWHGEDAPLHINDLINVQKSLNLYFNNAIDMSVEVCERIIDIQDTVNNISGSVTVGDNLINDFDEYREKEEKLSNRSYKLESLEDEFNLLDGVCSSFMSLKANYSLGFDEILENWDTDPKKERIDGIFEDFIKHMDDYQKKLFEVRDALKIVVDNTNQVLES